VAERFSFRVNGDDVAVEADRDTPLLYVLRNDLGLKGTRFGCGDGLCGACSVILDGHAVFSCDTPLWAAEGHDIETIEGIAPAGGLHPLQTAFLDEQAGQCGFCLTGIIMRVKALFDENPAAGRADVVAALERNLCRCGSHPRILKAIDTYARALDAGAGR
jgi:nicotinate dehydrogenase subunit A